MVKELSERKNKFLSQLDNLEKQPQSQAEKKRANLRKFKIVRKRKTRK